MTFIVEFEPIGIRLVCDEPMTVAAAARQAGVAIRSVCGGKATCGKCLVRIEPAPASSPAEAEQAHLAGLDSTESWRLACRALMAADTRVYVPTVSQTESQVIQTEGLEWRSAPLPPVRNLPLSITPPSLDDQTADLERVAEAIRRESGVEDVWAGLPVLQALRGALREGRWQITVALRGNEIVGVFSGKAPPVGLAVDVGTTKVACYLVSLETGQTLSAAGMMNPQIAYGEDVMSRLEAAMVDPANADRMQRDVIEAINSLAAAMCATHGLTPEHLLEACLVGNTAMHHLFAHLPTRPLAVAPFVPALSSPLDVAADRLGLRAAPGARVHLPPPIAGFVGSDHLAFLLAAGFGEDHRVRLGLDIGTNTEIALQAGGQITSCSTASGPAFEGAHIRHGMRAAPGAIERVTIDAAGSAQYGVIGGGPAAGICGSGILDAVAEMRRTGIINARGRMDSDRPNVRLVEDGLPAFCLARGTDGRRDVLLSQPDIDQILLAKGAMRAGVDILLAQAGLGPESIDEIVIAGAFGSYLDPQSAVRLGLLPGVPLERIHAVGNAAGTGARMMLASTECRARGQALARRIRYVELTVVPGFNRYFAQGMRLPAL